MKVDMRRSFSSLYVILNISFLVVPVASRPWGTGVGRRNSTRLAEMVRRNEELLRDHLRKEKDREQGQCYGDWTHNMLACLQSCDMWCWATVATMAGNYYKGENWCDGWECAVATYASKQEWGSDAGDCCPVSDHCDPYDGHGYSVDDYCDIGGGEDKVIDVLNYFTGGSFAQYSPLDQETLDAALNSERVVLLSIDWAPVGKHGGHWLIVGGCGDGYYYLHDPWGWYDQMQGTNPEDWQGLTYEQLLRYPCPGIYRTDGGENIGVWTSTVMWSWDDAEGHTQALARAKVAGLNASTAATSAKPFQI